MMMQNGTKLAVVVVTCIFSYTGDDVRKPQTQDHRRLAVGIRIESISFTADNTHTCSVRLRLTNKLSQRITVVEPGLEGAIGVGLRFWRVGTDRVFCLARNYPKGHPPPGWPQRATLGPGASQTFEFRIPLREEIVLECTPQVDRSQTHEVESGLCAVDVWGFCDAHVGEDDERRELAFQCENKKWITLPRLMLPKSDTQPSNPSVTE